MIRMKHRQAEVDSIYRAWFPHHRIAGKTVDEHIQVYSWRKDGTSMYCAAFVFLPRTRTITVTGDIGNAIYSFSEPVGLKFFEHIGLEYFASKCVASPKGRGYIQWSADKCLEYIQGVVDEKKEMVRSLESSPHSQAGSMEKVDDIWDDAKMAAESQHLWTNFLQTEGADFLIGDNVTERFDAGEEPSIDCLGHMIALHMMWEIEEKADASKL